MADDERHHDEMYRNGGFRPIPDPTELTDQAVQRSEARLKELVSAQFKALEAVVNEKFEGVDEKFVHRDKVLADALAAWKELTNATNKANSEAIHKAEKSTNQEIEALKSYIAAADRANDERVSNLKERVIQLETIRQTVQSSTREGRAHWELVVAVVAVAISFMLAVFFVVDRLSDNNNRPTVIEREVLNGGS